MCTSFLCYNGLYCQARVKERKSLSKQSRGRQSQGPKGEGGPAYAPPVLHPFEDADCAGFLPMTRGEMDALGWERPDFVLVSGDAYVDHPSFGTAIIGRVLEAEGFKVAILPQPDWHNCQDFKRFGRPRLAFLVNSGVIDSMVNHYTAAKRHRSGDVYAPGGKAGQRPDRAVIVYCNRIREAYRNMPIVIGGLEASLRRFAHYDYWSDSVRRSVLVDAGANLLIYGMGENPIREIAQSLDAGVPIEAMDYVRGTAYLRPGDETVPPWRDEEGREPANILLADFDLASTDKRAHAEAYAAQKKQSDTVRAGRLLQPHGKVTVCANPAALPIEERGLDGVYALPYQRRAHPLYAEHIPALDEVEFSVTSCRGCFGNCSFCALTYHQGRGVHSRSHDSIQDEVRAMTENPRFKGYVHDVGGPTANFRQSACAKQARGESCTHRECMTPKPCPNLRADHSDYTRLLRSLRQIPGVKKVFIRSGLRYDYMLHDKSKGGKEFLDELVAHHISGQLKIAPEHIDPEVLAYMNKPGVDAYERFRQQYAAANRRHGKEQYLVPYFISSHPGSDLRAAIELAQYMRREGIRPEQVQDFYPTPGTRSTVMFHTGYDPATMQPVFVPRDPKEKKWQRALLQSFRPENAPAVRQALSAAGREDLIGYGKETLVRPQGARSGERGDRRPGAKAAAGGPSVPRSFSGGTPKVPAAKQADKAAASRSKGGSSKPYHKGLSKKKHKQPPRSRAH